VLPGALSFWSPKQFQFGFLANRPDLMRVARNPAFDHGAALRTPPAHDARGWERLWTWLGDDGAPLDEPGAVLVRTPVGWVAARPGDWIILTVAGKFHVTAAVQ
jgi:hypothetical protein